VWTQIRTRCFKKSAKEEPYIFTVDAHDAELAEREIGVENHSVLDTYSAGIIHDITIRCTRGKMISPGSDDEWFSAVYEYTAKNGRRFAAGGGGPVDLDTIRLLSSR
jgi:hypothetical protein